MLNQNKDNKPLYFVHWGGCPRPTYLQRNVPAGDRWIYFYKKYYEDNGSPKQYYFDTIENIVFDLRKRMLKIGSRFKSSIKVK